MQLHGVGTKQLQCTTTDPCLSVCQRQVGWGCLFSKSTVSNIEYNVRHLPHLIR